MFQGDNKRHSRVQDHTHKQNKKQKNVPCPKSSSDASWRDLSYKDTQQKSITVNTQRKNHDISQALSVAFKI